MTRANPRLDAEGAGGTPPVQWAAALAKHDRWLRTIILARTGEAQAVDEVMQEVALGAVRQRAPLADRTKVAPWLYKLAVRQSLLYRRRMGRKRRREQRYGERYRPTEEDHRGHDPLGWLLAEERRQLVRTAMERLSRRDAEILLLKYTEGWSYLEIAVHVGASHSAVESRLHRARAQFRRQLAALDVVESQT
ncbi:MAG: sigma-70 family RNA polymerase sigma factor [Pirellulales bacterium]